MGNRAVSGLSMLKDLTPPVLVRYLSGAGPVRLAQVHGAPVPCLSHVCPTGHDRDSAALVVIAVGALQSKKPKR
jgi:hypothetical protein